MNQLLRHFKKTNRFQTLDSVNLYNNTIKHYKIDIFPTEKYLDTNPVS